MRSIFASTILAYAGFFTLFALAPAAKTMLDYCVAAASGLAIAHFAAGKLPVTCRCSHFGETIFRVRFDDVGVKVPCPDCLEHELHVPPKTFWQVVWQNFRHVGFGHDLDDVAFDCPILLKKTTHPICPPSNDQVSSFNQALLVTSARSN